MALTRLHHDFETYSAGDLPQIGTHKYARHKTTEVLMLSYAFDEEPVEIWTPAETVGPRIDYFMTQDGYQKALKKDMPKRLARALLDPNFVKIAWNKPFEWNIFFYVMGIEIPHDQWRDSMVLSYSLSLPGSLDAAGKAIGLPPEFQKDARGKALMKKFSMPRTPTKTKPWTRCTQETDPEDWQAYKEYCIGDTESERAIWRRLVKWNLPREEWEMWFIDQAINQAGIPINMRVVENAIVVAADVVERRIQEMKDITGLQNPNSTAQLLAWLRARRYPYTDLKKGHVAKALERLSEDVQDGSFHYEEVQDVYRVLELRQEVSKASVKKYLALDRTTGADGLLRNVLQFCGAGRTWRWAGRIFQPQNLAKPVWYLEKPEQQIKAVRQLERLNVDAIEILYQWPMDLLSTCIRPVVQAPPGKLLIDADLNAIENRCIGWIANSSKILNVFKEGRCPYVDFASHWFKVPYEILWHEYKVEKNKARRTLSKAPVLGCFGPDTLVLTTTGWKRIVEVQNSDLVFDGIDFVSHEGVIDQGLKETVTMSGVQVTTDHEFLIREQTWKQVKDAMTDNTLLPRAIDTAHILLMERVNQHGIGDTHIEALSEYMPPKISRAVKVLTTYDVLNAGPRNRFTILTDAGPMIVHNCGYRLSGGTTFENATTGEIEATGLLGYAWNMGIAMTLEESISAVKVWRETYPDIVEFWYELENAAMRCVRTGQPRECRHLRFEMSGPLLRMRLPSGRHISYVHPRIEERMMAWGKPKNVLTYMGLDDQNRWVRLTTHGGKILENGSQAISRDVMCHGIKLAVGENLDIRFHVHDQVVGVSDEDKAEQELVILIECLSETPSWAKGFPLAAEGIVTPCFVKD